MAQYLGELRPEEIRIRESSYMTTRTYGQGVQQNEKLGFAMQFKVGDVVQLINVDNNKPCRGRIESSQDWGGYTVTIVEGPRSGETITVAWNYVTPAMAMQGENKQQDVARRLIREAVSRHPIYQQRMAELRDKYTKEEEANSKRKLEEKK